MKTAPANPELVKLALSSPAACSATLAQLAWIKPNHPVLRALKANVQGGKDAEEKVKRILAK